MSGAAAHPAQQDPAQHSAAQAVLRELEQLLADERRALVELDRDAIEAFAARQLELDAALTSAVQQTPLAAAAPDRALLTRVRKAALANQLLIAHARSCVQGVLTLLAPGNAPGYSPAGNAAAGSTPPPMALNLRR
jgi:hypothetical protein